MVGFLWVFLEAKKRTRTLKEKAGPLPRRTSILRHGEHARALVIFTEASPSKNMDGGVFTSGKNTTKSQKPGNSPGCPFSDPPLKVTNF